MKIKIFTIHHAGNSFGRQYGFSEIERMHAASKYVPSMLGFHTFYNFVIEPDGLIIHCREFTDEIHVCVVGGGDYRQFSKESIASLKYLVKMFSPEKIQYHKDYSPKTCPGKLFPYDEFLSTG